MGEQLNFWDAGKQDHAMLSEGNFGATLEMMIRKEYKETGQNKRVVRGGFSIAHIIHSLDCT